MPNPTDTTHADYRLTVAQRALADWQQWAADPTVGDLPSQVVADLIVSAEWLIADLKAGAR